MAEKIVAIVGARLNSSRLPRKHLLPLAGQPMIARLFERLQHVGALDQAVLATTADSYNADLATWAEGAGVDCFAYDGDVNDLMGRVDAVVKASGADIILYVCGDCPLIDPGTLDSLLAALKADTEAETVSFAPNPGGQGSIHIGFNIYRRAFWDRMEKASTDAFEREHVGSAWNHTKKVQPKAVARYTDQPVFQQTTHRTSVDTGQDYRFMNQVYGDWYRDNAPETIVSVPWVIDRLLNEPALTRINADVHQRGVTENPLNVLFLCDAGEGVGLGHLARTSVAALALQGATGAKVWVAVRGREIGFPDLRLLPHEWVARFDAVQMPFGTPDVVITDVKVIDRDVEAMCRGNLAIGIDADLSRQDLFTRFWMPSLYLPADMSDRLDKDVFYGPDCFLLRSPALGPVDAPKNNKILVMTGGSDPLGLSHSLPDMLLSLLPAHAEIHWVQGPCAAAPSVTDEAVAAGRWQTLVAPDDLIERLGNYNAVICQYGVSFFECVQAGLPCATFDRLGAAKLAEWTALSDHFPDYVCDDEGVAIRKAAAWLQGAKPPVPEGLAQRFRQGGRNFAAMVAGLTQNAGQG